MESRRHIENLEVLLDESTTKVSLQERNDEISKINDLPPAGCRTGNTEKEEYEMKELPEPFTYILYTLDLISYRFLI